MKYSYLFTISLFCLFSCKKDKVQAPAPAPSARGFHIFSGGNHILGAVTCDNDKLMILSTGMLTDNITGIHENGSMWFQNNIHVDSVQGFQAIAYVPGNSFILGGRMKYGSPCSMGILQFNETGEKQWSLLTGAARSITDEPKYIIRLKDGNYCSLDAYNPRWGITEQYLSWFNADGQLYRTRQVDIAGGQRWASFSETPESDYLFTGHNAFYGNVFCAAKFSSQGDVLWLKSISWDIPCSAQAGIGIDGGETIIAGYDMAITDTPYKYTGIIMKLSPAGDIIWQKRFAEGSPMFHGISADGNGGLIITGAVQDSVDKDVKRVLLLSISADGTEQWRKVYTQNGLGKDVFRRSDGGYTVVGNMLSDETFFVLITDKNGNIE